MGRMSFVRWHYRDGVYVRSHHRRSRSRVDAGQTALLPVLVRPRHPREPAEAARDPLPLAPVAGQAQLPLGA